jgi:hypothetical protein
MVLHADTGDMKGAVEAAWENRSNDYDIPNPLDD